MLASARTPSQSTALYSHRGSKDKKILSGRGGLEVRNRLQISQGLPMTLPAPVQQAGVHFPDPAGGINLSPLAPSDTITSQEKRDSAWRYEGYQAFTKWMASDDDFFVFRRFESLNAQVLLWMQDRIVRMENKLQDIHKLVEGSDRSLKLTNGSFRTDETNLREREEIMRELSATMHHYSELILQVMTRVLT